MAVPELEVPLGPLLTDDEAAAIFAQGEEAVVFALLEPARQLKQAEGHCATVSSPATPSGMTPVHHKPAVKKRAKKTGPQGRASRGAPRAAGADRRAKNASGRLLPALPGTLEDEKEPRQQNSCVSFASSSAPRL